MKKQYRCYCAENCEKCCFRPTPTPNVGCDDSRHAPLSYAEINKEDRKEVVRFKLTPIDIDPTQNTDSNC